MAVYHKLGEIPRKRHSIFRQSNGCLYYEELMGNKGFVGPSSLLYHIHRPTQVENVRLLKDVKWQLEDRREFSHRHIFAHRLQSAGDTATLGRMPLLFNHDVAMSLVRPSKAEDFFYRNAQGDEVVYVTEGSGRIETLFGDMDFRPGDYVVVPRGILHRWLPAAECIFMIMESAGEVRTPKRYRNEYGQLMESAPYSERDFRKPGALKPRDEKGEFRIVVKKSDELVEFTVATHPFDVIGWDGYYYPYIFNIHDFEPRVGRFHLPPPVHQTFEGDGFVICSFCPRPYDFDPEAVPAPYNHSNVMSDEVLYYANSEFMSRKGIEYGSVTLHPDGIPHGPHPGRAEDSIGKKQTDELAVMLDTFRPLHVAKSALEVEDGRYIRSWLES